MKFAAFAPLFHAATTIVTPASRARQMALCSASLFELPQLLSEAPPPPSERFATVIGPPFFGALLVTKSIPQITLDHEPEPALFRTRTAQSFAPGATPTTPTPLSNAAIVPATCVPCPLPSLKLEPVEQFLPPTILVRRSGWLNCIPVSMTATLTPVPLLLKPSASMRLMPVGSDCSEVLTASAEGELVGGSEGGGVGEGGGVVGGDDSGVRES